MSDLILIRHGKSEWNSKNIFTGWVDIPLSKEGVEEAKAAGRKLADIPIDVIFTSTLIRGIMTALLVMNEHKGGKIPVLLHPDEPWSRIHNPEMEKELIPTYSAWELNERMYGDLQGMNKQEMREKFGADQVHIWRRSYDVAPPNGESLEMTAKRTLPYFENTILPALKEGKNVLVSAHGNSLRSIIMEIEGLSREEVVALEVPTGEPLFYTLENGKVKKKG